MGHAWVEIYLDGMGWVPVDVTPGFYLDAYMLRQLAEHPQQVQRTVSLSDDDASIQSQPQRPSSPPKQDTEQAPSPLPQLLLGGGLAGGLAFQYYPLLSAGAVTPLTVSFFAVYGLLCFTPVLVDGASRRLYLTRKGGDHHA